MSNIINLRLSDIYFAQDSISYYFKGTSVSVETTFKALLYGEIQPGNLPYIEIMDYMEKHWAVDGNRRLYVFKKLEQLAGTIKQVRVKLDQFKEAIFRKKHTTKNGGTSVKVRGAPPNLDERLQKIVDDWRMGILTLTRSEAMEVQNLFCGAGGYTSGWND